MPRIRSSLWLTLGVLAISCMSDEGGQGLVEDVPAPGMQNASENNFDLGTQTGDDGSSAFGGMPGINMGIGGLDGLGGATSAGGAAPSSGGAGGGGPEGGRSGHTDADAGAPDAGALDAKTLDAGALDAETLDAAL